MQDKITLQTYKVKYDKYVLLMYVLYVSKL